MSSVTEHEPMPTGDGEDVLNALLKQNVILSVRPTASYKHTPLSDRLLKIASDLVLIRYALKDPTAGGYRHSLEVVVDDLKARMDMGEKKYGTRLKTNNGRNVLMDLYQEILDAINYAKQGEMEGVLYDGHN